MFIYLYTHMHMHMQEYTHKHTLGASHELQSDIKLIIKLSMNLNTWFSWFYQAFSPGEWDLSLAQYCIISKALSHISYKWIGECHAFVCAYVYMWVCICIFIYTHVHALIHIHICTYIVGITWIPGWSLTHHEVKHDFELLILLNLASIFTWWVRPLPGPVLHHL